jgi:hypothetical protein
MRAERLGSYSIVATLPGTPYFSRLKSIRRKLLLMSAALVADGQVARVAASAGALLDRQQRLVRRIRRQVVVDQRGLNRSVGVIGLYVLIAIVFVLDA